MVLPLNWADWTILGILAVSSLISIKRGFIKEALSLVTWLAAVIIAVSFRDQLGTLLENIIETPSLRPTAASVMLFVGTLIVGGLTGYLVGELVKISGLSGTDRLLGMIFGLARGAIVVLVILMFLPKIVPVDRDPWWQASRLIPPFLSFEDKARAGAGELYESVLDLFNNRSVNTA